MIHHKTKDTAQVLSMESRESNVPGYSTAFHEVMTAWVRINSELETAFELDQEANNDPDFQRDREQRYDKAGRYQRTLFESVVKLKAVKIIDILAKLELWKDITCPTPESECQLSLSEQLLLSAYKDLHRLVDRTE